MDVSGGDEAVTLDDRLDADELAATLGRGLVEDQHLTGDRVEDDHLHLGGGREHLARGGDPVQIGHAHVHQDEIGPEHARALDGGTAVIGLADHLDARFSRQHAPQAGAHQVVVVDKQHTYGRHDGYLLFGHARNELRRAVELYERAIELEPGDDKAHYQLISARAALQEQELPVALYERRVGEAPGEVRERRFLAVAYLQARAYERALETVEAGVALAGDDAALIAPRGEARAGLGDAEGALADWRRALELAPEDIGALYSSAFLLERENRLPEAIEAWQSIIDWNEARGYTLQTVWPKQELERLRSG